MEVEYELERTESGLKGIFQECGGPNINNRIYPTSIMAKEVERLQEDVKNRKMIGRLGQDNNAQPRLIADTSHVVTELEMRGDDVYGEVEIIDTPNGKTLKALLDAGIKFRASSSGYGTLSEGDDKTMTVMDDFRLTTFDIVSAT